ncbi:M23 family metallopeptidase [Actinacidiphila sp. bgisy167]|uniref:M23 family metallopeptidase n=1 Tax=Actinacidiphila sp. bgisy167 TaxID=3413797 RepID=UPI003D73C4D5
MNDRHPAGYAPQYSGYGYEGHSDASYASMGAAYTDDIPPFGSHQRYPAHGTGAYTAVPYADTVDTGYWPSEQTTGTPGYGEHTGADTGAWYPDPSQTQPAAAYDYAHYEHTALHPAYGEPDAAHGLVSEPPAYEQPAQYGTVAYAAETYDTAAYETGHYDTGTYEAGHHDTGAYEPEQHEPGPHETDAYGAAADDTVDATPDADSGEPEVGSDDGAAQAALPRPRSGGGGGSRRRRQARRSALLTVAVPSVAVMGVACAAAVTVNTEEPDSSRTQADGAPEATNAPTTKFDQQLAVLNRDVDDFTDRASRSQERIDLKERQALERAKKAAEAALKEQVRPKFLLPVSEHGLSAYFGQAGVNWMSVHTGIDFPVNYGTPVMAATDGVVRTQWNSAYGNMAVVTAPDGTETWYCHLSSTKIRSGSVKAGDVIAYSGNSGNSTGPHLHFEVRPSGGAAIDPLQWLIKHGVDPR